MSECRICSGDDFWRREEGLCRAITELQASAQSCATCALLVAAITEFDPRWMELHKNLGMVKASRWTGDIGDFTRRSLGIVYIDLIEDFKDLKKDPLDLEEDEKPTRFSIRRCIDDPTYKYLNWGSGLTCTLQVVSDTSSTESFSRISAWMANCKQHHKACRIPDLTFKPTRLIDVGRAEEGRGPHLMRPKDAVQYAALSYCWGPKSDVQSVLKTKKTNIDHYMTNIPLQLLPQTIQDAIKLCQGINIRYLWVDSLCILQDDKDDWSRESGLMRHIYYNSYLTITAAYPDSCKKGFLGKQSLGERGWQRRFRAKDEFDEVSDKFCIRLGSTKSATDEDDSPLSKRGWTLQESILPICKIIFNGEEMKWTCNEETFCECGHLIGHHEEDFPDLKGAESPIVIGLPGGQSPHLRAWIQVVREYSNRKLTEPMDKLSAVSGLAQFFQEANTPEQEKSDTYLAGLWRDNLQFWLTWRVDSLREYTHSRPLPYRAPTWSWASVDGPVQYHDIDNSGELQPCDFNIHEWRSNPAPPGNDRTGAVVSAHLLVSGLFAPVQLVVEDTHSFLHPEPFFQECVYQLFGDGTGGVQVLHLITSPLYQESKYPSFAARGVHLIRGRNFRMHDVCVDIPMAVNLRKDDTCYTCWHQGSGCDVCSFDVNPQFFCLKVCRQRYDGPESSLVYSLILKRSFTVKDAFERVGMGCWLLDSNDEGPWKGAERATIKLV